MSSMRTPLLVHLPATKPREGQAGHEAHLMKRLALDEDSDEDLEDEDDLEEDEGEDEEDEETETWQVVGRSGPLP